MPAFHRRALALAALIAVVAAISPFPPVPIVAPSSVDAATFVADGFESGSYALWTRVVHDGGFAYVTRAAARSGTNGLRLGSGAQSGATAYLRVCRNVGLYDIAATVSARVRSEGRAGRFVPLVTFFGQTGTRLASLERRSGTGDLYVWLRGSGYRTLGTRLPLGTWATLSMSVDSTFAVSAGIDGKAQTVGKIVSWAGGVQLGSERAIGLFAIDFDDIALSTESDERWPRIC